MDPIMLEWHARMHHEELLTQAEAHRKRSRARRAGTDDHSRQRQDEIERRRTATSTVRTVRTVAFVAAVFSVIPYLTMKILWLGGSRIGMRPGSGVGEMHDLRFVIGNVITVALALLAIVFAVSLLQPRRRLVPGWLVVLLGGGSSGLLAPIVLGLPVGAAIQLAVRGTISTGAEGNLRGAVFVTVYSGFGLLGITLAVLLVMYVMQRWHRLVTTPPQPPTERGLILGCGIGMLSFAVAMMYWGVAGPGHTGPAGFTAIEQRVVLIVIALLAGAGFVVGFLRRWTGRHPRSAWLIGWIGCATAALQGPTLLLLAQDTIVHLPLAIVTVLATPAALVHGLTILRRSRDARRGHSQGADATYHSDRGTATAP